MSRRAAVPRSAAPGASSRPPRQSLRGETTRRYARARARSRRDRPEHLRRAPPPRAPDRASAASPLRNRRCRSTTGSPGITVTGTIAASPSKRGAPTVTRARRYPRVRRYSVSSRSTPPGSVATLSARRRNATSAESCSRSGSSTSWSCTVTLAVRGPGATSIVSVCVSLGFGQACCCLRLKVALLRKRSPDDVASLPRRESCRTPTRPTRGAAPPSRQPAALFPGRQSRSAARARRCR